MHKDKQQRQPHRGAHGQRVRDPPREARQEHEEGEEVGEAGIGPVPGVLRLFVVVDGAEDLFGADEQGRHLPDGHLKVHGRELEESDLRGIRTVSQTSITQEPGIGERWREELYGCGGLTS